MNRTLFIHYHWRHSGYSRRRAAARRRHRWLNRASRFKQTSFTIFAGKPNAIALLAPPPLPDSPEQVADMAEVQAVYHAAPSNDIAIAFSEKKFSIFNFTPAIGAFFQSRQPPPDRGFFTACKQTPRP